MGTDSGGVVDRLLDRLYEWGEDPRTPPKWARDLVVAYADDGEFYLPCIGRRAKQHGHSEPWWDRPLNPRRLSHLPYLLLSVATGWIVWVESC